jgi:hypothetical protein
MQLTESQLKKIIMEELQEALSEQDLFATMEHIFVNAMDGAPLSVGNVGPELKMVPESYYSVMDGRVYPTKQGKAYLKAKGIEVEKY